MENTVENVNLEGVLDDAAFEPEQEMAEPVSDLNEITEQPVIQEEQPKEPGWMKKRIDAAVSKALKEYEQRMNEEFEERVRPFREAEMNRQAEEMVSKGLIKDKDMALEYLKLKGGMSVSAPAAEQTKEISRDAQGRFAPKQQETQPQNETDGEVKFRANMLAAQANKLQQRGLDVKAAYENNPEFQRRVLSGEWDFYDVAEAMTTRKVPQPVRQPNGAGFGGSLDISSMTDEQFAKLNARLAKGDQFR